jgi:hypothetical protein
VSYGSITKINMADDNSFGPLLRDHSGFYDFTLSFEDIILLLVPLSIATVALLVQICAAWWTRERPKVDVGCDPRFYAKIVGLTIEITLAMCSR